jgi:hypothetical protein
MIKTLRGELDMRFFILLAMVFVGACSSLAPTGGNKVALNNERSNSMNTIIFGRIVDLNPQSVKGKLQITYTLSKEQTGGMFGTDSAFPNIDPETNYFWVSVPTKDVHYFGIRSIRFMINGVETAAIMRDEIKQQPLFGIPLENSKDAKYIYVGDITIRSGVRKTAAGLNLEVFDIKEAYNKTNPASAKSYLQEKGFDTKNMIVKPMNLRKI